MDENMWLHSLAIGRISKKKNSIFSLPQKEKDQVRKKNSMNWKW